MRRIRINSLSVFIEFALMGFGTQFITTVAFEISSMPSNSR
jgi:hypothetical protein